MEKTMIAMKIVIMLMEKATKPMMSNLIAKQKRRSSNNKKEISNRKCFKAKSRCE